MLEKLASCDSNGVSFLDFVGTGINEENIDQIAQNLRNGMYEAEKIGELHAIMVIPRPLDDLMRTLPKPEMGLELLQPLQIPLRTPQRMPLKVAAKELERELVELPELRQLPAPLRQEAVGFEPAVVQEEELITPPESLGS